MLRFIPIFALLVATTAVLTIHASQQSQTSPQPPPSHLVKFPENFIVTTGTTIPLTEGEPISQSGTVFLSLAEKKMRVDNRWMGKQRSFIVDMKKQRGFLFTNEASGGNFHCVASKIKGGDLMPFAVPRYAEKISDSSNSRNDPSASVRHISTHGHFRMFEHDAESVNSKLLQHDFYVRQHNLTHMMPDGTEVALSYYYPLRIETRAADRKEIAPPPREKPNWRFFGSDLSEEDAVVNKKAATTTASSSSATNEKGVVRKSDVQQLVHESIITIDFFDFVPIQPDPSIFDPPAQCNSDFTNGEFDHDVDPFEVQRHLTELSLATAAGDQVVESLAREIHSRKLESASSSSKSSKSGSGASVEHPSGDDVHVKDL